MKTSDYLPSRADRAARPKTDLEARIKHSVLRDVFAHFERVGNAKAMRDLARGWGEDLDKH